MSTDDRLWFIVEGNPRQTSTVANHWQTLSHEVVLHSHGLS
jgi:hypothetical protein